MTNPCRWLSRASNAVLKLEKPALIALTALLLLLILLNIVTRAAGSALFWVDELAVYTLVWMALLGASVMVRMRTGVAVTLVTDQLPPQLRRWAVRLVDAVTLMLAVVLLVLCWIWYDPIALLRNGFDFDLFAQNTFKFIYSEPTNTVGIRKFWIWLAVPLMALNMSLHALANLVEGPPADDASEAFSA
jgi:TRAP-type C4-dicarboxylate transport system permease small subunit